MSVRNMLKVMMSLLLAVTLAATTAHAARLDQSHASVAEETLQVKGKSENSGLIPYTECMKTCSKCACTKMWPPEINWCSCSDDSVPKKAEDAVDRLDQSPASVLAAGKLNDRIPYFQCQTDCTGVCVCDRRPPEFAECICSGPGDTTDSNKPAAPALLHTYEETLQVEGKLEKSGLIPYTECIKTCSNCACTRKWPPESNMCLCLDDDSVPKKATAVADRLDQSLASVTEKAHELYEKLASLAGPVPKRTGGDDKKIVLWTASKMEATIPYKECIKTCETCACTLIYPPEAAICICITPKAQAVGGKAVAK